MSAVHDRPTETGPAHRAAWPAGDYSRVPYWIFQEPKIHALEQSRLFQGACWNFLCLAAEIPTAGDYKVTYVGDMSVIVVRDESGQINGFENRCGHRGSLLALKSSGHGAKDFTCVYHAWRHDLTGEVKSVAFQRGIKGKGGMPADFDMTQFGPRKLRIEVFHGLVFGTFDVTLPDFSSYIGPMVRSRLERVVARPLKVLGSYTQVLHNNWKLYFENAKDSYHSSILHLFFTTFNVVRLTHGGGLIVDESGGHHVSYSSGPPKTKDSEYANMELRSNKENSYRLRDPAILESRDEYDEPGSVQILSVFPNLVVQQIQNSLAVRQIVPKGPEETHLVWTYFGYEDDDAELTELRLKHANLVGPAGYVSMEDGAVGNFVQRGIKGSPHEASVVLMGGRGTETQEFRATEVSLRGFWKSYRNLMGFA